MSSNGFFCGGGEGVLSLGGVGVRCLGGEGDLSPLSRAGEKDLSLRKNEK